MFRPTVHRATRLALVAVAPLALGAGLTACSSSGSAKAEPCPASVDAKVTAKDTYRFEPGQLEAKAGKYVVQLDQGGAINHTFQIHGADGKATVTADNKQACATFTLAAGTYTYFCGVSGHEGQGMKGTLTVS